VLVGGARVAVVDWETAGLGPGVLDLAALVVGWDPDSRSEIVGAYDPSPDPVDLAAAELVLALRCLGLPPTWTPPPEHRRDWLAEARASARMLL
jgi:thiamine kinase-like enzyme